MKNNLIWLVLILFSALLLSCDNTSNDQPPPRITAQGFTIEEAQSGIIYQFHDIRLRIESVGRVQQLRIRERSYDIDLATTREPDHFGLFGLQKKAFLRQDITLDFSNYINQKLSEAGEYQFTIEVTDKHGKTANTVLKVRVVPAKDKATPIETGQFQLQRTGKGVVKGSGPFGLNWKTVDEIKVTIHVRKAEGASKLTHFTPDDFQQLSSKEQLGKWIHAAKDINNIEFDTTGNAATGQVLGVHNLGKYFLLRVIHSDSSLSSLGTTVRLAGEFKY